MTHDDVEYVASLLRKGYIHSPCLELGVGLDGINNRALLSAENIKYYGTDIVPGPSIDFAINFEDSLETIKKELSSAGCFGSVLVLNVLEHTFDPIKVLDNILGILGPGGTCIIITPAVWPLHNFPIDCWRILPQFYVEYAKRRGLTILDGTFQYIGQGRIGDFAAVDSSLGFPSPSQSTLHYWYSRLIHKLFNTFGRGMSFPAHVAVGVVLGNRSSAQYGSIASDIAAAGTSYPDTHQW